MENCIKVFAELIYEEYIFMNISKEKKKTYENNNKRTYLSN